MLTNCLFNTTKYKLDYYRGKNCMKNFCQNLKEHATKIIDYRKKDMIPLTMKKKNYIVSKKYVIYAKKDLILMIKNIIKSEIINIALKNIKELLMIFTI